MHNLHKWMLGGEVLVEPVGQVDRPVLASGTADGDG